MEYRKLQGMIVRGYSGRTGDEWKRLTKSNGIMEYITTIHYLEKYLPKNGVVADIGSGPGRYSLWLAQHGYDVVSVDPIEKSIKPLRIGNQQGIRMLEQNPYAWKYTTSLALPEASSLR